MLARRASTCAALTRPATQAAAALIPEARPASSSRPAEKWRWGQMDATFSSALDCFAEV